MVEQLENNGQVVEVTVPTSSTQLPNDVTVGYPQVKAFAKAKMKPMNSQKTSGRVRSTEVVENPLGGGRLERSRDDRELQPGSRHPGPSSQDAQHGECLATDHPAHHREQGEMIVTPEWHHLHAGDIDAEVMLQSSEGSCKKAINPESVKFWQLVEEIESETSIHHLEKTFCR